MEEHKINPFLSKVLLMVVFITAVENTLMDTVRRVPHWRASKEKPWNPKHTENEPFDQESLNQLHFWASIPHSYVRYSSWPMSHFSILLTTWEIPFQLFFFHYFLLVLFFSVAFFPCWQQIIFILKIKWFFTVQIIVFVSTNHMSNM